MEAQTDNQSLFTAIRPSEALSQEPTDAFSTTSKTSTTIANPRLEQSDTPTPVIPQTSAIVVSVFEKILKRDNETLERILQRLTTTFASLTEGEQHGLLYYLKQWDTSIQQLIQQLESTEDQ